MLYTVHIYRVEKMFTYEGEHPNEQVAMLAGHKAAETTDQWNLPDAKKIAMVWGDGTNLLDKRVVIE